MQPDITIPKTPAIKIYSALLSQTGTNNPTAIVMNSSSNNFLGNIIWTYFDVGSYIGTLTDEFPDENKVLILTGTVNEVGATLEIAWNNINSVYAISQTTIPSNDLYRNFPIEIRVYYI